MYFIGSHDLFHLEHGYARLRETIVIFADGTSWTLVPGSLVSYIGEDFVMYFIHQMLFWPHTLGGICYKPKFHHRCLPDIRPTHIPSLPKYLLNNSLEILLCQGPCTLTHYCTRVHTGRPTTACVYLTKHKKRKVAEGTKSYGSVNWNSRPCMAKGSSKTLAPSSL